MMDARDTYMRSIVPVKIWAVFCKNGYVSSEVQNVREDYDNARDEHGKDFMDTIQRFVERLGSELRNRRYDLKKVNSYNPLKDSKRKSKSKFSSVLTSVFPRSVFEVDNAEAEYPMGTEPSGEDATAWNFKNYVRVPLTWYRGVYQRGMSAIKAPDGIRVPLKIKYRNVFYVEDAGYKAYQVTAIKVHKKLATVEEGYLIVDKSDTIDVDNPLVTTYTGDANVVHAYKTDLKKAFNLMNSRTIRDLNEKLMA